MSMRGPSPHRHSRRITHDTRIVRSRNNDPRSQPQLTHIIAEPCVGTKDTSCVDVCPVDCIHPTSSEPAFETVDMLAIDPDVCIDCGLCVDACPVAAIYPEEELPAEWADYIRINAEFFRKPPPAS